MQDLPLGSIIHVSWRDIQRSEDWTDRDEILNWPDGICHSLGFVTEVSDLDLTITSDYFPDCNTYGHTLHIPWGAILSWHRLQPGEPIEPKSATEGETPPAD